MWIPAGMMSAVGFMTVLNAMRVHEDSLGDDTPEDDAADGTRIVIHSSAWTGR